MRVPALLLLFAALLGAQTAAVRPELHIPPGAEAGPSFNPEGATRAYLATIPPAQKARSDAYFEGGYWLILWDFLYGTAVYFLLLSTRLSARMRDLAERATRRKSPVTWLYFAQFSIVSFALGAPLAIYEGFIRERSYGLMNQTFAAWSLDQGKSLGVTIVLGGLVAVVLFTIVRRLPRTWHLWGAGAAIVLQASFILIFPLFVAPIFNRFTLLTDARVRDPILRVARQNGIAASNIYQVDASRQSKRVSANVSGFLWH